MYVASYFYHFDERATVETMYLVFPVAGIFFSCSSSTIPTAFLGTFAYHRFGPRAVISTATILLSLCLLACSFMTNFITFICVYSVLQGGTCSCIIFPCLFPPWMHYPKNKGTVTGVTMIAYGGGCALQGIAFTFLMNPNNESPDMTVHTGDSTEKLFSYHIAQNCPFTFRMFAVAFAVIGLSGMMLISEPDEGKELRKNLSEASLKGEEKLLGVKECPGMAAALRTWTFWCLMIVGLLAYTYDYYLLVQFKTFATPYIANDHYLSIIGSIGQLGNVLGRLVMTVLVDYVDNRLLLVLNCLGNSLLAFALPYTVESGWQYTLCVAGSLFFFGFSLSPTAVICGKIFGAKTGGKVVSFTMLGTLFGNLSTIPITQLITLPHGYEVSFRLLAGLSAIACVTAATIKVKYDWQVEYEAVERKEILNK